MDQVSLKIAFGIFIIAWCHSIYRYKFKKNGDVLFLTLLMLALSFQGVALGIRWVESGHGPFLTMFEVLSGNVFTLGLVFFLVRVKFRVLLNLEIFALPILFVMMGWTQTTDPMLVMMPITYNTIWLWVHLLFGKLFLGLLFVSVSISLCLLADHFFHFRTLSESLSKRIILDIFSFKILGIAFVFEGVMLLAGAVWAQDAWGRYWSWDSLEAWSFVTWIAATICLHTRLTLKTGVVINSTMVIIVFILAFLTFFGIPFVTLRPHQGFV